MHKNSYFKAFYALLLIFIPKKKAPGTLFVISTSFFIEEINF